MALGSIFRVETLTIMKISAVLARYALVGV